MRMRLTLLAVRLVPVLALLGTAAALLERYVGGYYLILGRGRGQTHPGAGSWSSPQPAACSPPPVGWSGHAHGRRWAPAPAAFQPCATIPL